MKFSLANILPNVRKPLEKLSGRAFIKKFYLAGGTAVALFFHHRRSDDLDFFSMRSFQEITLIKHLKKFGKYDFNIQHIIKSLTYFDDADKGEMPDMYIHVSWPTVKAFFREERLSLAKKFFGIGE